jgi:uncharacterized repeat protein (TIGR01451 family)
MNVRRLRPEPGRLVARLAQIGIPLCLLALVLVGVAGASAPPAVTDVNPTATTSDPKFGGRVNALAVNPVDTQDVYAAGELSGLFHSTDGGKHWSHVDAVSLFATEDVEYAPTDASLIIAAGDYDGRATSQGGIWRSTDGGATWANVDNLSTCNGGEANAYHVAIAPTGSAGNIRIWVGTDCGLVTSANSGATWSSPYVPNGLSGPLASSRVWDVQARDAGGGNFQVDVCGDNGYRRSTTSGTTAASFTAGTNPMTPGGYPNGGFMPCSLATAPQNGQKVYMTFFDGLTPGPGPRFCIGKIVESVDGGSTWETQSPSNNNCRATWVVTHPDLQGDPTFYDVFIGASQQPFHQRCKDDANGCAPGGWGGAIDSGAHPDPSDIAFDTSSANGCPILLSNDGGIDRTTVAPGSCATSFAWEDSNVGNHGYDIRGLAGTVTPAVKTDLYFATQDNGMYYTGDGGVTYHNEGPDEYDVFADHNPPARVLFRHCFGCGWSISNPGLAGQVSFSLPPGDSVETSFRAAQFGHQSYAFMTHGSPGPPDKTGEWRVYITTDEGGTWPQFGGGATHDPLPGQPAGPMVASGPPTSPTLYFILNTGASGAPEVWRLSGSTAAPNSATLTKANSGLNYPTTIAVDPADPDILYAYDLLGGAPITGRVFRSINGGNSWTKDNVATSMITHNGEFKTYSGLGPLVTSIAFDGNSGAVMLGTQTAGIFESPDDGGSWLYIRGSEMLPRINGFFFDERIGATYVATRGRGLWRINTPSADLSITKTSSPNPVLAGNQLYYTITVTNNGPDTSSSVTVKDLLPSQVSYVTSTNPTCSAVGQLVTCSVPDLASGASYSFQIKVAVKTGAAAGGPTTIFNTASVSSDEILDPDSSNNSATAATIVEDQADLAVTKLCKPDTSPSAGQPIDCTVFVDNNGPSDARGVVLTDAVLGSLPFTVSNIATSQGTCTSAGPAGTASQQFTCNLGVLVAATTSQSGRATITYQVSSLEGQDINNKASVRSDTPDPDASNNEAIVSLTVSSLTNLSLTKSGPSSVVAGTPISWSLDLGNAGPSTAKNVVVTDSVPAGVRVTSVSGSGGASCTTGVPGDPFQPAKCGYGSLASGASRTMTVDAMVLSGTKGSLENDARISSDTFDPSNSDNLANTLTTVTQSADLAIGLTSDSPTYKPSSTIHYKVTVDNFGPSDADAVVVTVDLPPTKVGYYVSDSGGCTLSNVTLTCPLGTFVAGAPTKTFFIDFFVQGAKGAVTTTASVASATPDPVAANNTASVTVDKK